MRYLSRLVIALSMMVVVSAVAPHPARAKNSESLAPAPAVFPPAAPPAVAPVAPVTSPEPAPAPVVAPDAAPTVAPETAPSSASDGEASPTGENEPRAKRRAKAAQPKPAETAPDDRDTRLGGPAQANHKYQTGLWVMPGTGYRLIVPYKENQTCGDSSGAQGKRVCAHSVPAFLDFQLSFGVVARLDLILDVRFGLQQDPAVPGSHQFAIAPGLRFWLDQDVSLKFFTTLQFVYDYTNFSNSQGQGISSSDVGVRNANGLMYDPIRNVGFFVQFGETIGFMRWFRIDLDVGLGAQIRFP
jgi:hypothetical protein